MVFTKAVTVMQLMFQFAFNCWMHLFKLMPILYKRKGFMLSGVIEILSLPSTKQVEKMEKVLKESEEQTLNPDFCKRLTAGFK